MTHLASYYAQCVFTSLPTGKTNCQLDQVLAKNPTVSKSFSPLCDEKGMYEEVQTDLHSNQRVYWCVEKTTGKRTSDMKSNIHNLSCVKPGETLFNLEIFINLMNQYSYINFSIWIMATKKYSSRQKPHTKHEWVLLSVRNINRFIVFTILVACCRLSGYASACNKVMTLKWHNLKSNVVVNVFQLRVIVRQ